MYQKAASFTVLCSLSGLFGTSAPKPTVKTTIGATSAQGTKAVVLDYFAHKLCPKHLQRNRYLMYYSYVKRCYTFVITDRADWFTAKADCASNGGNLMNIHQSLENFYLGMRDQIALGHADAYIWIGLSDTVTPGNFSWINGTGLTNTPYFVHISTRHVSNGSRYRTSDFQQNLIKDLFKIKLYGIRFRSPEILFESCHINPILRNDLYFKFRINFKYKSFLKIGKRS